MRERKLIWDPDTLAARIAVHSSPADRNTGSHVHFLSRFRAKRKCLGMT
jgi:hypothetical protein